MNEGHISKRYAKALLEFATSRGEEVQVYGRMGVLLRSLRAVPRVREALHSPLIPFDDKVALLAAASGGGELEESLRRFMKLVVRNERGQFFESMALNYISFYRKVSRITVVSLTTAVPASEEVVKRIREDVESRTHGFVEMAAKVDPAIRGGLIFQVDDLRLDASVKGQLDKIRRQFRQQNKVIV